MSQITDFFQKQPFVLYRDVGSHYLLFSEFFPISDKSKIDELQKAGYEVDIANLRVRNVKKIKK